MTIKSIFVIAATTVGLGLLAPNARAALISGVTVSTNMGGAISSIEAGYTVNGAGLPGDVPSLTGDHASGDASANAWFSSIGTPTGNITFNLNGTYSLAGFSFWNFNGNNQVGINGVTVQSSTDGTNFSTIADAPTQFAIGTFADVTPPEIVSFSPVTASYVRFVVTSNYGATVTGFSEVQFDGTPVTPAATPEPGTVLGLLAIGGGLVATRRRRN